MPLCADKRHYPLRVLHVIPSLAAIHGGPSRAMGLFERALGRAGVRMEIATTDDDGPGLRLLQPGEELARSVRCHRFAKRSEFYKFSPALGWWLMRHAADYDLLHIHALFSFSSLAAAWAAWRAGVPYIVRPLGTLTRYGMERRRPALKQASLRWLEGPLLRRAAAVHFTAEAEREEAALLGIPMRGAVLPLAVDALPEPDCAVLFARFPALRLGNYVLFLSRLDPKKNVEALLGAIALLQRGHPDLQLVLVGDGDRAYVAQLKQRAALLGIADRLVWTGFLDGALKAAVLKGAAVFALPSFSENFGIAAAEALLAGLPCVLGRGVAIAAEVEAAGAGRSVEPEATATAQALGYYLADAAARAAAGAAARRLAASHYSVDTMGRQLLQLYTQVLNRHAGTLGVGAA